MKQQPAVQAPPETFAGDAWLDVLDRIGKVVPPGLNPHPAGGGWVRPGLGPAARRR